MSYGTPPPPPSEDDRSDPTSEPQTPSDAPPPSYGQAPPPPPPSDYGQSPPPPPPPPSDYGQSPPPPSGYGQAPPPAYNDPNQPYGGAAPAYTGPYEQAPASSVGTLAQWPQRALGWLIDFVVLYIPGYILYFIGLPKADPVTGLPGSFGVAYYLGALYILAVAIYNRWYRGGTTGQTIGRGVAGVKVVRESDGQVLGMGMAFVRDLAHIVDSIICYVGWLFPLWDSKRQTIADKIMSTVSVTVPKG
ncbi:MAG: RDD family protein [Actinomycetota bacterium]|nr:RDD family protein [Actinomycetota bacterium]